MTDIHKYLLSEYIILPELQCNILNGASIYSAGCAMHRGGSCICECRPQNFSIDLSNYYMGLEELLDMSDSQARDTSDLKVEKVLMMKCHLRGAPLMTYLR